MLTFYINRAGKELTDSRRTELEKAKAMLSDRIRQEKESSRRPGYLDRDGPERIV
jgi:hypothetical protein